MAGRGGGSGVAVPGGQVEAGESAERTAVRKTLEETGLTVQALRLPDERAHPKTGRASIFTAKDATHSSKQTGAPARAMRALSLFTVVSEPARQPRSHHQRDGAEPMPRAASARKRPDSGHGHIKQELNCGTEPVSPSENSASSQHRPCQTRFHLAEHAQH
ncbi:NUDIX hydrolase [Streptomyces noursei]|uniref:NUDIX hydrolase n=1 Tax=Streptomyces noursei TaxID=1971 RepID=UPI003AF31B05